jgi:hypothetical protein
LTFDFHSN